VPRPANGPQVVEDTIQASIGVQAASLLHAFGPPETAPAPWVIN